VILVIVGAGALLLGSGAFGATKAEVPASSAVAAVNTSGDEFDFGPREAVPQLPCQPGDNPETDLQGRVPPEDVASGRAAEGYSCNLSVVGRLPSGENTPAVSFDSFKDCVYFGTRGPGGANAGVKVLDASNPERPVATDMLTTPAMMDPGETLRVNVKRKLLVATGYTNTYPENPGNAIYLDIYDVSGDCRHPRLISSTDMSPAAGHEGWFSPDGETFYMSTAYSGPHAGTPTLFPIDIRDPAKPRLLASSAFHSMTHGGVTTEDGARTYACTPVSPPDDTVLVLDTKQVAERKNAPKLKLLEKIGLEDNQWCQSTYRVTYDGRPHLIQFGERSATHSDMAGTDCARASDNWANFAYPRVIDIANERKSKVVGRALLEVHLPEHCQELSGEGAPVGLGYSAHFCSPDRLYDPTILVCSWFHGGLRVLDIRDPRRPVEIGYYNPGVNLVNGTAARPVVRAERGEIWFVNDGGGFYVLRFEDGIWPFNNSEPCPEFNDYYYASYNPESKCRTANFNGIGKPAPGGKSHG